MSFHAFAPQFAQLIAATITSLIVMLCAYDRGLNLLDSTSELKLACAKAVCTADGIAQGLSVCLLFFNRSHFWKHHAKKLIVAMEEWAGVFATYSLIVGPMLLVVDYTSMTLYQLVSYPIVVAVNWHAAKKFWGDKRSKQSGLQRPPDRRKSH